METLNSFLPDGFLCLNVHLNMNRLILQEKIEKKILLIRRKKVMLDVDLAELYQVKTKVLNQAVKRNAKRFPKDFMFQLTKEEKEEVVTICDHLSNLKFSSVLPYAFTEQGVSMLSSVLNSERGISVNIQIMRTFTKLREMIESNIELKHRIEDLEKKYDKQFQIVFDAIKHLIEPEIKPKRRIGFYMADEEIKNLKGFKGVKFYSH